MIGILLISKYGVPNKRLYKALKVDSSLEKDEETKIFVMSQYGLMLLLFGFVLQMFSMVISVL
ncbi:hypothetical protein [uncultured Tenacibaculum sp.]|uniref:hypothetical protein n=1 Tax=uncultured Tenacibaculum sp. TaxID=174713 RepID=UPI0026065341|nr:hypothetical protein [uncultured Tenacibaculum sp.]